MTAESSERLGQSLVGWLQDWPLRCWTTWSDISYTWGYFGVPNQLPDTAQVNQTKHFADFLSIGYLRQTGMVKVFLMQTIQQIGCDTNTYQLWSTLLPSLSIGLVIHTDWPYANSKWRREYLSPCDRTIGHVCRIIPSVRQMQMTFTHITHYERWVVQNLIFLKLIGSCRVETKQAVSNTSCQKFKNSCHFFL